MSETMVEQVRTAVRMGQWWEPAYADGTGYCATRVGPVLKALEPLVGLEKRAADAEREAAQEKARNAELAEQLRVAREATREAVDREMALLTQCNYARDKVERTEAWLASAKAQHLADVGTLSRCLEARDKRVAELEDRLRAPAEITVPAGYVRESWVREQWDQSWRATAEAHGHRCFPGTLDSLAVKDGIAGFKNRMGWRK